jgi:hypothetical protein
MCTRDNRLTFSIRQVVKINSLPSVSADGRDRLGIELHAALALAFSTTRNTVFRKLFLVKPEAGIGTERDRFSPIVKKVYAGFMFSPLPGLF